MIIPFVKTLYNLEKRVWRSESESAYYQLLESLKGSGLASLVYVRLQTSGSKLDLPQWFLDRVYDMYQAGFYQNLLIKKETERLLRKLGEHKIPVIPLKGTVLAERYFGHFAARGTSDIDLLVKPEHLEAAAACIAEAGFNQSAKDNPVHYHTEWMKEAPNLPEPLTVELHWSLARQHEAKMNMRTAWELSIPLSGYESARVWLPTYTFYTLCLHGASHQLDASKYIVDLLHMISQHHERIDIEDVLRLAEQDQTLKRVKAALSIVYMLAPELSRLQSLPWKPEVRYWSAGFLEHNDRDTRERFKLRRLMFALSMLDTWRYRWLHIRDWFFPSAKLADYSLDEQHANRSRAGTYLQLYRQRLRKLMGG
jgi:hypothetical protein